MLLLAGSDLKVYIDKKSGSVWDGIKRKCGFYDDGRKENENVCWADASDVFVYSGLSYEYFHEFPNAVLNDNNQTPMKNLMPPATVTSEDMLEETVEVESNMDDFTSAIGVCGPGDEVWKQPRMSKDLMPTATVTSEDMLGETVEGESNMDDFTSAIGDCGTGDEMWKQPRVSKDLMPAATVTSEDVLDETAEGDSNMDEFASTIGVRGPGDDVWKQPRVSKHLMPTVTITSEDMLGETAEGESNMDEFASAIGVSETGDEFYSSEKNASVDASEQYIKTIHTDMSQIHTDMSQIPTDMSQIHTDMSQIHTDMSQIPTDMSQIPTDMSQIPTDMSQLHTDMSQIHTDMSQIHTDMSQIHTDMSQTVNNSNALSKVKTPQSFDLPECNSVIMHKGQEDYESAGELTVQVKYPLKQYVDFYGKQEMINDDLVLVPEELDLSDDQDVVDMNIESLFDTDRHLSLMEENHLDKAGADHFIKPFFATRRPTEDERIESEYYENFKRGLYRPANFTPFVESLAEDCECLSPVGTACIDEAETSRTLSDSPAETSTRLASTSTTDVKILKKIYQCDLCSTFSEDRQIIMTHLREAEHYSASSVLVDGDTPRNTLQQYCIKWEAASYKNPIPVCPHRDCPCIFLHIYASASHYSLFHDEEAEPQYALAELVKEDIIKFDHMVSSCKICSKVFSDRNLLLKHLKATDHFPYSRTENTKPHFLCCHCNHTFDSFLHAGQHVIEKKRKKHFSDIRVMHISFMKVVKKLLPFQSTPLGRRAAVISEVYNLKCLKQNVGRSAKKMINERIKYLRTLIGK